MDRFIEIIDNYVSREQEYLKSNMDRFIEHTLAPPFPILAQFKIQYG